MTISEFKLSRDEIQNNITKVTSYMKQKSLDALYINSTDEYLNEYTPLAEAHSYYFSGFTGSVCEMLFLKDQKPLIFVDGRYHVQADQEIPEELVSVQKCSMEKPLKEALVEKIEQASVKKLGFESKRTSLSFYNRLKDLCEVSDIDSDLEGLMDFKSHKGDAPIYSLSPAKVGASVIEKLEKVVAKDEMIFISSLDALAWMSNCRGFSFPFQSTFPGKGVALRDHLYLLIPEGYTLDQSLAKAQGIEILLYGKKGYRDILSKIKKETTVRAINLNFAAANVADYNLLSSLWSEDVIQNVDPITSYQSLKNSHEVEIMKESISKADQAIVKTLRQMKEVSKESSSFSEFDFYELANSMYKEVGTKDLSFSTIAAVEENGAIVHFGNPSKEKLVEEGNLLLLDSGAFFEDGYATDCTRSIVVGNSATPTKKKVYTLVLKGLLAAMNCHFPEGAPGSYVDAVTRKPLFEAGFNFNHGTGHGVGINVHEKGYGISTRVTAPLRKDTIGSIEPGIYLDGEFGVRLENIVRVVDSDKFDGFLMFENMTFVGFDHDLIDMNLLSKEEVEWLESYENECRSRSTSMKS